MSRQIFENGKNREELKKFFFLFGEQVNCEKLERKTLKRLKSERWWCVCGGFVRTCFWRKNNK